MKSYNHLWEEYWTKENLLLAIHNVTQYKGGKHRKNVRARWYRKNTDRLVNMMKHYSLNFKSAKHTPVEINDGVNKKKRKIIVPTMREQIVHHMVINVMKPIFMKTMFEHSYGSIPGRGVHSAKKVLEKWIRTGGKNTKYCLKMDIRKFFDSVPRKILKEKLAKMIHDQKFLKILYEIVDTDDHEIGIPIGFYTSQWFANFYLTDFDHYVKEVLHVKYYMRYMDDMIIFGGNKRELHFIRKQIEAYLQNELGLEMKKNWQVFRFDYILRTGKRVGRDLDFMGFRFFRDRTLLRKKMLYRLTRKARRICRKSVKTVYDCRQMLSYLGWIDSTNTYGMYKKWVKPFICFQYLKRRVSSYQKRINIERMISLCGI